MKDKIFIRERMDVKPETAKYNEKLLIMTMVSNCHFYHQILGCDCEVFRTAALGMLTLQRSEHQKSEGFDKQT